MKANTVMFLVLDVQEACLDHGQNKRRSMEAIVEVLNNEIATVVPVAHTACPKW